MPSIKDVAAYANVSIATVSRIINGNYPVKEETKNRVEEAMEKLNYVPNEVARSLKTDSTRTIGFLVSDISNSFFITIAKSLEDVLSKQGYGMIVCSTDHKKEREAAYIKMLASKKVDGIILNTTGENNTLVGTISQRIPTVLIERRIPDDSFIGDYISHDNYLAIRLLTSHLINRNHRDIGVVNGHLSISSALERHEAFTGEMEKAGVAIRQDCLRFCNDHFTVESGYLAAERMFSQPQPPTALIVMNNVMTVGVLKYLRQHDIRVPEDVSIVNYGDIENSDIFYVNPTHSTMSEDLLGIKAAEMLFSRMENPQQNNRETLLFSQLVTGNTTKQIE